MRPVNLKMSAFGPYADKTEIPMDELGTQGLYLITGDTGAGKTTIFDAICFALYGEASGDNRESGMLRSKYAADDVPTEVELTFYHCGKEYTVKRNPEYMRASKRGNGLTKQTADAELHMPDGKVITKVGNVTAEIENILGVNKDQFSQIAMIAQGDFLKLLLADTKSRMEAFRELFKTQNYMSLQKKLDFEQKKVFGDVEDAKKSVTQYISGIRADNDDVLSIDVEKAVSGNMSTDDVIGLLDKLIEKDVTLKSALDSELDDINGKLAIINAKLGAAEALIKTKESLDSAEKKLAIELPKTELIEQRFNEVTVSLKDKTIIEKNAAKIEAELPYYDQADRLQTEISAIEKSKKLNSETLDKTNEKQNKRKTDLENLKKEHESLKDTETEIEKLNTQLQKIIEEADLIKELSVSLTEYSEEKQKLDKAQKDYILKDSLFNKEKDEYESKEQAFRDGQAGILAQKLKDGQPCPVCGSKSHPTIAKLLTSVPTEKELDDSKKKVDKAREERENSAKNAEAHVKVLETKRLQLTKQSLKLLAIDEIDLIPQKIDELMADCKLRHRTTKEALNNAILLSNRKTELEKIIPTLEKEISDENVNAENLREKIAAETSLLGEKQENLNKITTSLVFANKKEAEAEKSKLDKEAKKLQDEYDIADKSLKDQKIIVEKLKSEIESLKKTISSSKAEDPTEDKKLQQELNLAQKNCIDKGKIVSSRINTNTDIKNNILNRSSKLVELEQKLQWMRALSDTANGKLSGKEKIMLETFIQMTYFDRIINRANLRLMTMSSGQYELIRMKEAANTRSQSGLDLGVIDHYNGTERSVKTLSGGESFMASLSLALGLSDEVQSSAGGIQIDTMFVDEGFGSLDPESLDQAYRALAGLTEGNKLVGIISHVSDLKVRIDKQLVVTKNRVCGSSVRIVV